MAVLTLISLRKIGDDCELAFCVPEMDTSVAKRLLTV